MGRPEPGIPYAQAEILPNGDLMRTCPECGRECMEQTDADGEPTTNTYGEHYEATHQESYSDEFGDIEITPFEKDVEAQWPPETKYLFELPDDTDFTDDDGRTFTKIGDGPVQGTVEVEDEEGTHAYLDVTVRVSP